MRLGSGVLAAAVLAACGSEPHPDRTPVVHPDLPAAEEVMVGPRLGADPDADGVAFTGVRGLAVTPEGELLVLDGRGIALHRFDHDGRHLGTVGRAGEGPGELGVPVGLHVDDAGAIWIADLGTGALSRRAADGGVDSWLLPLGRPPPIWTGGLDASGSAVFRITVADRIPASPDRAPAVVESAFPVGVVRWRPGSADLDTLVLDGVPRRGLDLIRAGAVFPFEPERLTAPAPDGSVWTAVSDTYRIVRLAAAGDTLVDLRVSVPPLEITPAERDAAIRPLEDLMDRAARVSVDWDAELPGHHPALEALTTDAAGRLWVQRRIAGGTRWDVFDEAGAFVGAWTAPVRLVPWLPPAVGDGVLLGVEADALGVETVVCFAFGPEGW